VSDMNTEPPAAPLFVPPNAGSSHCVAFLKKVNEKYGLALDSYFDLYRWSIDHVDLFWDTVWDDVVIVGYKGQDVVDNNSIPATNPPWFSEARINWAENMLTCRSTDKFALIQASMSKFNKPFVDLIITD
jgi:acetoacetyl-CoA synthetase